MYLEQCEHYACIQWLSAIIDLWSAPVQTTSRQQTVSAAVCADSGATKGFLDKHESALCISAVSRSAQSYGLLHRVRVLFLLMISSS